jgi:hypothetical protein
MACAPRDRRADDCGDSGFAGQLESSLRAQSTSREGARRHAPPDVLRRDHNAMTLD